MRFNLLIDNLFDTAGSDLDAEIRHLRDLRFNRKYYHTIALMPNCYNRHRERVNDLIEQHIKSGNRFMANGMFIHD